MTEEETSQGAGPGRGGECQGCLTLQPVEPHRALWHTVRLRRRASSASCAAFLCLLGALALAYPAAAATPDRCQADKDCKTMTERAAQLAAQTRYEEALSIYQAAYDLSKEPRILVNIGRCQYRLGRSRKALDAYAKFQAAPFEPEPELQARVRQFAEEAERAIAADAQDGGGPAPAKEPAPATQSKAPLYVPKDAPAVEPAPSALSLQPAQTAARGRPAWRVGLGIGMAVLGVALGGLGAAAISAHGRCDMPLDANSDLCTPMVAMDGSRTISVVNGLAPGIPLLVGGIVLTAGGIAFLAVPARQTAEPSSAGSQ